MEFPRVKETFVRLKSNPPEALMAFIKDPEGTTKLVDPETGLCLQRTRGWLGQGTRLELIDRNNFPVASFVANLTFLEENGKKIAVLSANQGEIEDSIKFHSRANENGRRQVSFGEQDLSFLMEKISDALQAYGEIRVSNATDPRLPIPSLKIEVT